MTYTLIRTRLQVWDQVLDSPVAGTVIVSPSVVPVKDVAGNRLLFSPAAVHLDADGWYEADLPASDDPGLTPTAFGYTFDIRTKSFNYSFTTQVRLADATLVTETNPETGVEYTHYELDLTGLAPVLPEVPISEAVALRNEMLVLRDDANDAVLAAEVAAGSINKGLPGGTAELDLNGKLPESRIPTTFGRRVLPGADYAAEDAAALAAGIPLLLAPGTHTISADLTIASPVVVSAGAQFSVAATKTLTLSGYVVGPPFTQIFAGVGAVVLTKAQTVYADYWGQKGTATSGTDTIQRAFDCTAQGTEIRIGGKYWTTGIDIHADEDLGTGDQGKSLVGIAGPGVRSRNTAGEWGAEIYLANSQHRDVINVTGVRTASDQPSRFSVKLDGFKINGNKASQTTGAGLTLASVKDFYIGRLVIESCKGDGLEGSVANGSCNQVEWDHLEIMACDAKGADFGAIGDSHGNFLLLGSNADVGAQFAGAVQVNQVHSYLNGVGLILMGDRTQLGLVRVNDSKGEGVRIATGAVDNVITHLDSRDNGTDTALTAPYRAGLRVMGTATKNHVISMTGGSSNGTQQYGVRYDSTLSGTLNTIGRYAATGNVLAEVSTAAGVPASNVALVVNGVPRPLKGVPFSVLDFGAKGDGTTDDSPAIQAAIDACDAAGGGTVLLPFTTNGYGLSAALVLKSGVRLLGDKRVVLKPLVNMTWLIGGATNATNASIENLGLTANGKTTSYLFSTQINTEGLTIKNCRFFDATEGVETRDTAKNFTVTECLFEDVRLGIRVNRNPDGVFISRNVFRNWEDRAIQVLGNTGFAVTNLWITDNIIRPHKYVGLSQIRQPIQFNGVDDTLFTNVHVNRNTVIGPDKSYDDPTTPGTADMISLHRCKGFEVSNNMCIDGGEVGITIALQCEDGVVSNNVVRRSDTAGICVGSSSSAYVRNVSVTGNTVMDCGMSRLNGTPGWAANGINLNKAESITISGNRCGDTRAVGSKTQLYGMSFTDSTDIEVGANNLSGNGLARIHTAEGGNSAVRFRAHDLETILAADLVVNNEAVQQPTALSITLEPNATYTFEGLLSYSTSSTADASLKWTTPAGSTMVWTAGGLNSAATGSASASSHSMLTENSTPILGGIGATPNTGAQPCGSITTTADGGSMTLTFAQNVAEVSDTILRAGSYIHARRIA